MVKRWTDRQPDRETDRQTEQKAIQTFSRRNNAWRRIVGEIKKISAFSSLFPFSSPSISLILFKRNSLGNFQLESILLQLQFLSAASCRQCTVTLWSKMEKIQTKSPSNNSLSHERGSGRSERGSERVSAAEGASEASIPEQVNERAVRANERTDE